MLNTSELKLLQSDVSAFPLLKAVAAGLKKCNKCNHGNVNVNAMLRVAITRYAKNQEFIEHCRSLFPLPCMIGGILIK